MERLQALGLMGYWDRRAVEGEEDRSAWIDWRYEELDGLIHKFAATMFDWK